MQERAAHRAAVNMTVRDITVWFRFGDSLRSCGRWCGRASSSAGWLVERILYWLAGDRWKIFCS